LRQDNQPSTRYKWFLTLLSLSFACSLDREARKTSSKTRSSFSTLRNSTPTVSWCTHLTVARRTSTGGSSQGRFIMSVSFWPGRNKRLIQSRAPLRETSSKVPSSESSVAHDLTEASPVTAMRLTKRLYRIGQTPRGCIVGSREASEQVLIKGNVLVYWRKPGPPRAAKSFPAPSSSPRKVACPIFLLRMVRYLHPPISVFRLSQVHS
jgi:hypothetical protein